MKLFVAGATGAIGRLLLPKLVGAGHEVVAMIRKEESRPLVERQGARAALADVFDREAVRAAMLEARPDIVIHQLTALSDWNLEDNARIRIQGTRHLVDAAKEAGVVRMIVQSISWAYEDGDGPAAESVPLDLQAPSPRRLTVEGVASLEGAVSEMEHSVILRYGAFYGPGTWYAPGGVQCERVRKGELVASDGVTSFVHVEDAANAVLLALGWPPGPVNVCDDEPASGQDWLPVYAKTIGAPPPPYRPGRNRGERGAANALARSAEYGWTPLHPSWRSGFVEGGRQRP